MVNAAGRAIHVQGLSQKADESLGDLCHRLGASIGFDAVAGEMSARVLRAQPRGSRLLVYGALSLEASQIDPASLISKENASRDSGSPHGCAKETCLADSGLHATSSKCLPAI